MLTAKINRANETEQHLELKHLVGEVLKDLNYAVFYECEYCDIVAFKIDERVIYGVEIERSVRNLTRNIQRNFNNGVDKILIVTPGPYLALAINKKIVRNVPSRLWNRISVVTEEEFTAENVRKLILGENDSPTLPIETKQHSKEGMQ